MKRAIQQGLRALYDHDLLAVVFLTGGALLVIEIVAMRILSPYFGNTIYTYSSVITVILAALSGGYWFGGWLADRKPSFTIFYRIIGTAGVTLLALTALSQLVLMIASALFSFSIGPLISALILFGGPSVLLGMLSPYVIVLYHSHTKKGIGVGGISGRVFFWSTLGSIAGSLLAGFVLIPLIGIEQIMIGIGALLILLSLYGRLRHGSIARIDIIATILIGALLIGVSVYMDGRNTYSTIYSRDGTYEKITIRDQFFGVRDARFLIQDMSMSAGKFLRSEELIFDYTKYYSLYKIFMPHPSRVLVLGGGAYSIPKAYLNDLPEAHVDVSEIESRLYELAQQYFDLKPDPRLTNYVMDGRKLMTERPHTYDVIYGDVYASLYSIPPHFMTREFFETTRASLTDNGVFIANIIGDLTRRDNSFLFSAMHTFQTVFPNSYFFAVDSPYALHVQNIIFVGSKSPIVNPLDPVLLASTDNPIIAGLPLHRVNPERYLLASQPLFTDNYAPIEAFIAPMIKDSKNTSKGFSGKEAFNMIRTLLTYGPQYPGAARQEYQNFLKTEFSILADEVISQDWEHAARDGNTYQLKNIIARINPDQNDRILLVTHYDTIRDAKSMWLRKSGIAGSANNGRSGVAVLLELMRAWKENGAPNKGIDIVFFDGEEGEPSVNPDDQEHDLWIPLGSTYFVDQLASIYPHGKPRAAIDLDMVCDANLNIYRESNSQKGAQTLNDIVWQSAQSRDIHSFHDSVKYSIWDDHTTLMKAGIPSTLLIDFDYPYYATTRDTLDKCSPESLQDVGDVVDQVVRSL